LLVVAIVSLAPIVYFGRHYLRDLNRLEQVYVPLLPLILVFYFAARSVTGEIMRFSLQRLGHHIGRLEAFMLTILISYTNLAIPRAGYGPAAVYLKRCYGIPLADFSSLFLPIIAIQLPCIGALGLLCQVALAVQGGVPYDPSYSLVFGASLGIGAALPFLRLPFSDGRAGRVAGFLRRFNDSWQLLARSPRTLMVMLAAQVAVLLLRALRLDIAFSALEFDPPFWGVFLASLLADIVFLLSVTPAALGLREAAIAYGAEAMGVSASIAVTVTILDRLVWVVGVLVVGQVSLWKLRGRSGAAPSRGERS